MLQTYQSHDDAASCSFRRACRFGRYWLGGVNVPWNKFNQTSTQSTVINSAIYIDSSQTWMMRFQASASIPRLFRISIFMTKHGDWIDNGTGGELLLVAYEANQNPLFPDIRIELAMSTCSGTSYYRARPMQWLCSTYYAVRPGYFVLENRSYSFRVQSFSWNIATLPFGN
ncbi:CT144 hypothetical protein [Chlamydia pneumoniae J138]|nr:CT144 hypothetical protein [Chlamydia pneumoniae J138]